MELKAGYKQTEVGVIPEDWEVKKLGEIGLFKKGRNIPKNQLSTQGEPCVLYGEIYTRYDCVVKELVSFIPKRVSEQSTTIKSGDILFAGSGETAEEIGKCFAYIGAEKAYAGGDLIILSPREDDSTFLGYQLNSSMICKQKANLGQGSSVVHIYVSGLATVEVPLPPLPEQQAIAAALSDVDALISALDKLITKKRDIKQAAMQQLLTGKKRLPGFSGEWEVKKLGDVSAIKTGKKNNEDKVENGAYPFFVRSQTVERINTYSYDGEAVLVPGEGGIGSIFHYINGRFDYHQRVYKISDFISDVCGKFIYYCMLQNFNKQAMRHSVKATVDSLRLPTFQGFEFLAPSFDEQQAIVAVLSDMDAEIAALEQKRDKTRALKQGMMQELLTGRTRLV